MTFPRNLMSKKFQYALKHTGVALMSMLLLLCMLSFAHAQSAAEKKQKKQAKVIEMKDKALADLARSKPATVAELKNAPGYAVFDNNGIHLLLLASSRGNGV